ncbi:phiSA1p31-related protein [Streptomyces sp. NPDC048389]|uniref:phiSA1p31-related protein n=1 Tax=Streptomyces sp. NPDC048389 TaxID=3154622 RepID=UPI0034549FF5
MTTWVHDHVTFDLTRAWIDLLGHRWEWTGDTAETGEPLLRSRDERYGLDDTLPLSAVYVAYAPLIPAPRDVTPAERIAALTACARTTAASAEDQPPLPVRTPAATTPAATPDPLAYGLNGYRCGCGKPAHSNLVPCRPDTEPAPPAAPVPSPSTFARILARLRGGTR